ncbi:MAG: hypothetical protein NC299_15290 [Lachnospiraceae bacterium]|nr:hypothetical protein [Lachnospiraceae bacterium]
MPEKRTTSKRKYRRSYSPTIRLKICNEYLSGEARRNGLTQRALCKRYNIGVRTLQYWLDEYKNDYEALLDFYRFIMGDLAANGFRKAAEYLRDYAVDILTDASGVAPPQNLELDFDIAPLAHTESDSRSDEIADGLEVLNIFKNHNGEK